jgi:hypothetical protein
MTPFHAIVQILNDFACTIYILLRVESRADASAAAAAASAAAAAASAAAAVLPHALEPGYSHLYFIPREELLARVTIALGETNDNGSCAICFIALCFNHLCLLSGERLRVTDCCC